MAASAGEQRRRAATLTSKSIAASLVACSLRATTACCSASFSITISIMAAITCLLSVLNLRRSCRERSRVETQGRMRNVDEWIGSEGSAVRED